MVYGKTFDVGPSRNHKKRLVRLGGLNSLLGGDAEPRLKFLVHVYSISGRLDCKSPVVKTDKIAVFLLESVSRVKGFESRILIKIPVLTD